MIALMSYGNINVTLFITEGGFGGEEADRGPVQGVTRTFQTGRNEYSCRIVWLVIPSFQYIYIYIRLSYVI